MLEVKKMFELRQRRILRRVIGLTRVFVSCRAGMASEFGVRGYPTIKL